METADYCDYELSKRLKDCGFDEPCDHLYNCHGNLNRYADTDRINRNTNGHHTPSCSAPTLAHAQKWLREKKHLSVEPYANIVANFNYNIADLESFADSKGQGIGYESYECALAAGISASLELIKKGE